MININIKATNIELTPAIKDYVEKKVESLKKFIGEHERQDAETQVYVEVGRAANHHQTGDIYRAEMQIGIPHFGEGKGVFATSEREDLYTAIDEVKDEIKRELCKVSDRKFSLVRQGARKIKRLILGE